MDIKVIATGSSGNSYLISDGKGSLLIDAGVPIRQIQVACQFKLSSIDGCLISHSHGDHCKAHKDLAKLGVDIFLSNETKNEIGANGHRYHVIKPLRQFELGSWVIMPFDLEHDVMNLGYLIASKVTKEKLLYITDSYYCKYKFDGLTHMMVEANYDKNTLNENVKNGIVQADLKNRIIKSHMSIDTLLEMLKANDLSKLQQVYLIHMSNDNSLEDQFKDAAQRATGAEVFVC